MLALLVAQNIAFYIIAAIIVISAWRVVTTNNIMHAALYLVLVLAGVAGQYILLGAEFVATVQVLVYIGAIVVLFLFGIMLTHASNLTGDAELDHDNKLWAVLVSALMAVVMGYSLWDHFGDDEIADGAELAVQRTAEVSDSVFSTYIVPFEAISVLLLAALIGAIVVARRD
ncbi:MAG: NADH-quinone oxidoreductase subunit J [Actinomycetia bacterium]|nr:NADH-quinone oxidoreductase subunit J [Actinomycetes bacterium]